MDLRIIRILLTVSLCGIFVYFSIGGAQENPSSPAIVDETEFNDPLETPAPQTSRATKSLMNDVALAGQRIIAVGVNGFIIYSDDKGKSWKQAKVPVSIDLTAVYFPSSKKGWAVGHDGVVLHSRDRGETWVKQLDGVEVCKIMDKYYSENPPVIKNNDRATKKHRDAIQFLIDQGPVNPFLDVWFEDASTGFIIGAFNLIFRTDDGGKTWEPWLDRMENPRGWHLYAMSSIGQNIFIAGEQGILLRLLDQKKETFRSLATPYGGTFFDVLATQDIVLAGGMSGNIVRSRNRGKSWQHVKIAEINNGITSGTVMGNGDIVLVSQGGSVLRSTDGGESFSVTGKNLNLPLTGVVALNAKTLVLSTMAGVRVRKIP